MPPGAILAGGVIGVLFLVAGMVFLGRIWRIIAKSDRALTLWIQNWDPESSWKKNRR